MKSPVKLVVFTQENECMYCKETRTLIEELADTSPKLSVDVYDFVEHKDIAQQYKIDKIPATVVMGGEDYGIRFFGIPGGYEFASLLQDIKMISSGESGLSQESKDFLAKLNEELHLQVFVTPTCP